MGTGAPTARVNVHMHVVWPALESALPLSATRARQPRTLQALLQEMRLLKIGPQLKAAGSEALVDAEAICRE